MNPWTAAVPYAAGYRIGFFLLFLGILGFILNSKSSTIVLIICIEMILLAISMILVVSSSTIILDDLIGINMSIYILAIAGSEAAIGLAILVIFHKRRGSVTMGSATN